MCVHDSYGRLVVFCFVFLLFVFTSEEMMSGKIHIALNLNTVRPDARADTW